MPRNFFNHIKDIFSFMSNTSKIILAVKFMIPIIITLIEGLPLWIVVVAFIYLTLEFLFIFLCIKQVGKRVDEGLKEYEYEVIQRWDTTLTGMNDVTNPIKVIRIKDEIHQIPHPRPSHPSNRCRSCGANPTNDEELTNEQEKQETTKEN